MLRARPCRQIGPAFPDQFEREIGPQAVDLGEIHPEDRVERLAHFERRGIRLAGPMPGDGKLVYWRGGALLQPLQDCLDFLVTG